MPARLGRYEIVRELGKGAMGVVYEGRDPKLNRRVAIKTARKDVMESSGMAEEMMERFLREAHSAGALDHPNIITLYDAGQEGDIAFIAMEYLEGGDLRDVLDGRRHLRPEEVAEVGATICDALATAHARGIVHRDIKPANIMTPPNRPLKLADFGIAHVVDSNLTQDGALVGTPHYMSPEQFMGQKLDGRSDLFSVGVMLYELLTGRKPFPGEALTTVMHQVLKTLPEEPRLLNPAVSESLSKVVMKSLSKKPQERYATGQAMAAALRESLKPFPDPVSLGFVPPRSEATAAIDELPGIETLLDGLDSPLADVSDAATLLPGTLSPAPRISNPDMEQTVDLPRGLPKEPEETTPPEAARRRSYIPYAILLLSALAVTAAAWWLMTNSGVSKLQSAPITVPVEAHFTSDADVWESFAGISDVGEKARFVDEQAAVGKVQPLTGGMIVAFDASTGSVLDQETLDENGEGAEMLSIPGAIERVKFVVTATLDERELRYEIVVRNPVEWGKRQVFLLHE